jgi:type II secretory ATPase GspE/PulE/Tfp pilus assembly ATPase PilB-like protein
MALRRRLQKVLKDDAKLGGIFMRGKGCLKCMNTGIIGRTACAEMVIPDRQMREMFERSEFEEAFSYWRSHRKADDTRNMAGQTSLEHAIVKMVRSEISPIDLENEFGHITQDTERGAWDAAALIGIAEPEVTE